MDIRNFKYVWRLINVCLKVIFQLIKGSCSYGSLWNAFKIIANEMSEDEKNKLFYENAAKTYKIKF